MGVHFDEDSAQKGVVSIGALQLKSEYVVVSESQGTYMLYTKKESF